MHEQTNSTVHLHNFRPARKAAASLQHHDSAMSAHQQTSNTPTKSKAVVIGGGFGGLAAAARLGARGYEVTVLERLDRTGGRGRAFVQDGFTFDSGPTFITAPFCSKSCGRFAAENYRTTSTFGSSIPTIASSSTTAAISTACPTRPR